MTHPMDRRGPARCILALFVAVMSVLAPAAAARAGGEAPPATRPDARPADEPAVEPADDSDADRTVPTVSDFYPEDSNLSDCLGLVERPGCGSKARGGWRQVVVLGALLAGLGLIFWRISVGVRRNRADPSSQAAPDQDESLT